MDVHHKYDYTVLYTKHRFDDCENQCISALGRGVNIATMNDKLLRDPFVKNTIKSIIVWVKWNNTNTYTHPPVHYYVHNGVPGISTDKNAVLRCMCQRPSENFGNKTKTSSGGASVTTTPSPKTVTIWVNETKSISPGNHYSFQEILKISH